MSAAIAQIASEPDRGSRAIQLTDYPNDPIPQAIRSTAWATLPRAPVPTARRAAQADRSGPRAAAQRTAYARELRPGRREACLDAARCSWIRREGANDRRTPERL